MKRLLALLLAVAFVPNVAFAQSAQELLDNSNTEVFNFFELKSQLGDAKFKQLRDEVTLEVNRRRPNVPGKPVANCPTPLEVGVQAMLAVAASTGSSEEYSQTLHGAREVITRMQRASDDLLSGRLPDEIYRPAFIYFDILDKAADPRVKELARRALEDQARAVDVGAVTENGEMVRGLGRPALSYLQTVLSWDDCRHRQENTAWLKQQMDEIGWFRVSVYGADVDKAAGLILIHSDHDRAFQIAALEQLRGLLASKDTRPQSYAQLDDRVAVALNKPQLYGSQGLCTAAGVWTPRPIADPEGLDRRRAEVGLEPMDAYRQRFSCPVASPLPR